MFRFRARDHESVTFANNRAIVAGHPRADDVPRTFIEARATMHALTACRADPEGPKAAKRIFFASEHRRPDISGTQIHR
ncbi:MAG TPA: hypothetical protein VL262_03750, partial [Vicinamibacterales bacterium]|nr:hypothetical protein [Vicinamibacterales bacterium]